MLTVVLALYNLQVTFLKNIQTKKKILKSRR